MRNVTRSLVPFGLAALAVLFAGGCGKSEPKPETPPVTQRQRDSSIGESKIIPGARGVKGALAQQDSAARRKAILDSIAKADTI